MRRWMTLAVLALSACAPLPLDTPSPAAPPAAATPAPIAATPAPAPARQIATPLPTPRDACGAADLQGLVGRPRTEIPVPIDPNRQRVACTTCPVTEDFRPERLNFFFDAQTGLIRQIKCG